MQKQLSRLDYFTLKVMIGLFEYKNGSIVAEKLNSTQPKISRALSTMREVICDELFIRQQYGLQPNAMAERLYPLAQAIIAAYDQMAAAAETQPEHHKVLHISAPEHMSTFILQSIEQTSNELNITRTVDIHPWSDNIEQQINQGKIDYSFSSRARHFESVQVHTLGPIKYWFLAVRKGHPILQQEITLDRILSNKLVLINNGHIAALNQLLVTCGKKVGITPEVSLFTSSIYMGFEKIVNTDDICWVQSVFPYFLGKDRDDIELIDMTDFYNKEIKEIHEWHTPHHLLQYHDAHEKAFTDVLTRIMKENIIEHQLTYENSRIN